MSKLTILKFGLLLLFVVFGFLGVHFVIQALFVAGLVGALIVCFGWLCAWLEDDEWEGAGGTIHIVTLIVSFIILLFCIIFAVKLGLTVLF